MVLVVNETGKAKNDNMKREESLKLLADEGRVWDMVIIGGGATGLGCAVDAVLRGYSVALFEQDDFAKLKAVIPRESKDKATEEMFKQMAGELSEGLGTLKKTEYLGELNQSVVMDYIWKFTFEKMSADKDGKSRNLCKEVLYMVRMGRVDGRFVIVGSGFRF